MTLSADAPAKVMLVTGASGGFGGELARQLAQLGVVVVASGRNVRKLEKLSAEIERFGGRCLLYPMDLAGAQPADMSECVDRIVAECGRLDGVIHAAADFPGLTPISLADPGRVAQSIHVNLTARIWLTQAALPALSAVDGVVVVIHDNPQVGLAPYWGGYGLSQAAQVAFVAMLKAESPKLRVIAFESAPMPTALRARAVSHETNGISSVAHSVELCLATIDIGCEEPIGHHCR